MGHGDTPGPTGGAGTTVDPGTLARTVSPSPGPVGLASGGGGAASAGTVSMADQIVASARRRAGERVGNGECFTLVDRALRAGGARSAADFGPIAPDADYVWGQSVSLSGVQPGDVIQFRNYRYDRDVVTRTASRTDTTTEFQTRPHHTAIVERVGANGSLTVLEQNVPRRSPVLRSQLFFTNSTTRSGGTTTTIRVQGTFWFYRPQAR